MTSYVENGGLLKEITGGLSSLPAEAKRILTMINDRDAQVDSIKLERAELEKAFRKDAMTLSDDERNERIDKMHALCRKVVELCDEKVQLSDELYETVDEHIRKVDKTLLDFETEVREKFADGLILPELLPAAPAGSVKTKNGKAKARKAASRTVGIRVAPIFNIGKYKKWGRKWKPAANGRAGATRGAASCGPSTSSDAPSGPTTPSKADGPAPPAGPSPVSALRYYAASQLEMPVDPNEPRYCICNQVSFGEMIGCDNNECTLEWFHFSCMNLTEKPKGEWYCPNCAPSFQAKSVK